METAADSGLSLSCAGDTAIITFARPDTFNGISEENMDVFPELVLEGQNQPGVKYLVLAGSDGCFCSGGGTDFLMRLSRKPFAERREMLRRCQGWVRALMTSECMTVAAVDGLVAGAGFDLALAFDAVLLGPQARLNLWYTKLGVVPDLGGLQLLSQILGWKRALEFYAHSPTLDAEAAAALGLGRAEPRLSGAAERLPSLVRQSFPIDRPSFSAAKNLAMRAWISEFHEHQEEVASVQAELLGTSEFQRKLGRVATMQQMMRPGARPDRKGG